MKVEYHAPLLLTKTPMFLGKLCPNMVHEKVRVEVDRLMKELPCSV